MSWFSFPPVTVPIGTAFSAIFKYFFKLGVIKFLFAAVLFSVMTFAGYLVTAYLLPEWFTVAKLRESINDFSPPVSYALHLLSFYEGFPLMLTAMVSAWVVKKLPTWVWLGPLARFATKE